MEAVLKYPRPQKKDMQAFLGLAKYYRHFVPGFWTKDKCSAFEEIKQNLTVHPVLGSPNMKQAISPLGRYSASRMQKELIIQ